MQQNNQGMTQSAEVEKALRKMILDMDIGPGEKLTERWAETQFGTSRTPVRAALQRLEADGLVKREGRGWQVTPLDLHEIEQLFVYRAVLETAAIRLAINHVDNHQLDALEAQFDVADSTLSKDAAHDMGTLFHTRLAELSGNDFITRGVKDAITRLSRVRWLDTAGDHPGFVEHKAILAAMRTRDTDLAVKLIETHLKESGERLTKILAEGRRSLRARGGLIL